MQDRSEEGKVLTRWMMEGWTEAPPTATSVNPVRGSDGDGKRIDELKCVSHRASEDSLPMYDRCLSDHQTSL